MSDSGLLSSLYSAPTVAPRPPYGDCHALCRSDPDHASNSAGLQKAVARHSWRKRASYVSPAALADVERLWDAALTTPAPRLPDAEMAAQARHGMLPRPKVIDWRRRALTAAEALGIDAGAGARLLQAVEAPDASLGGFLEAVYARGGLTEPELAEALATPSARRRFAHLVRGLTAMQYRPAGAAPPGMPPAVRRPRTATTRSYPTATTAAARLEPPGRAPSAWESVRGSTYEHQPRPAAPDDDESGDSDGPPPVAAKPAPSPIDVATAPPPTSAPAAPVVLSPLASTVAPLNALTRKALSPPWAHLRPSVKDSIGDLRVKGPMPATAEAIAADLLAIADHFLHDGNLTLTEMQAFLPSTKYKAFNRWYVGASQGGELPTHPSCPAILESPPRTPPTH